MHKNPTLFAIAAAVLVLTGCDGAVTADYTSNEAVNQLTIDNASHHFTLRFVRGTARLIPGEAERVGRLIASGQIDGHDRLTVSPAGPPALAARRVETLNSLMLRYGLTVAEMPLGEVPRDSAILNVDRYLVSLPACPNWSKPPASDFTNMRMSNFGCATVSNMGEMVANPADLVGGRPVGLAEGKPAAAAVNRYSNDKVELPTANAALPIAAPSTAAPGAGTSPGS